MKQEKVCAVLGGSGKCEKQTCPEFLKETEKQKECYLVSPKHESDIKQIPYSEH